METFSKEDFLSGRNFTVGKTKEDHNYSHTYRANKISKDNTAIEIRITNLSPWQHYAYCGEVSDNWFQYFITAFHKTHKGLIKFNDCKNVRV